MSVSSDAVTEPTEVDELLARRWSDDVVPALSEYIRIPSISPAFEPDWAATGHIDRAVDLLVSWAATRAIDDLEVEVVRLTGRTPVIVCEIPATGASDETVLLYGHLDKQPEFVGWDEGLGPWEPVRRDDRLYGRGGADDGYAMFAALTAIESVRAAGHDHARCLVLIEASEESGSPDLPAYVDHLRDRLGPVGLVITLDAGGPTWDRLWVITTLRGLVMVDLTVEMLTHGIHSGYSGAAASTFRVARRLLDRIEDAASGQILIDECHVEIPAQRRTETAAAVTAGGSQTYPLVPGARMAIDDPVEAKLATTWRPTVSYTGAEGLPELANAGNVLRPTTTLRLSFRLPPTADSAAALAAIAAALTDDPPDGARITLSSTEHADGWEAPVSALWLAQAADTASRRWFGEPAGYDGMGGSIPFMAMLGEDFPDAQFLVTGVVGPGCNIHGPNEFLDLDYAERLTGCIVDVLISHANRAALPG